MPKVNACGKIIKKTLWIGVTALSLSTMMIGTVLLSTSEHAPHGKTCPANSFISSVADEIRRLARIDDEEVMVMSSHTRLADEVRQFEVHELDDYYSEDWWFFPKSANGKKKKKEEEVESKFQKQESQQIEKQQKKKPFEWAKEQKVRKDWNDLTDDERKLYFKAVNAMKKKIIKTPRGDHNLYDIFVIIHGEGNNKKYAHQTSGFLAWHRKYLLEFETAIRSLGEEFKWVSLPYWDWSAEMFECKKQGVFLDAEPCLTFHGASKLLRDFGGPGTAGTTGTHGSSGSGPVGCVTTGPFKGWKDHNGKCLSRGVNWKIHDQKPFTGRVRLAEIISQYPTFGSSTKLGFRAVLEGTPHGMTHNYLGGHLRSFISPADPIFFSHHAYVDKIWATWQDCHEHDTAEVKKLLESGVGDYSKYYQETRYHLADKVTDPLVFNFPLGDLPSLVETLVDEDSAAGVCAKKNAKCAFCVHKQDNWCATSAWDDVCKAQCTDPICAKSCGTPEPRLIDMHKQGRTVLPNWDLSEVTPANMQSTLLLGDRSYTYSPDEFERYLEKQVPELMGTCKLDSHKKAQKKAGSLLEVQRLHHSCKPRGEAAFEHASMVKKAFNSAFDMETAIETNKILDMKPAFKDAEKEECARMVVHKDGSKGNFLKEFNCKADQPRFLLPWLGRAQWQDLMDDPVAKHEVFQDPCCAGDEQALAPAAIPSFQKENKDEEEEELRGGRFEEAEKEEDREEAEKEEDREPQP